jgi:hypothetical protein
MQERERETEIEIEIEIQIEIERERDPTYPDPAPTRYSSWLLVEYVPNQLVERRIHKGWGSSSALVQHTAQGPQVTSSGVGGTLTKQLGSHVAGCATLGLGVHRAAKQNALLTTEQIRITRSKQ